MKHSLFIKKNLIFGLVLLFLQACSQETKQIPNNMKESYLDKIKNLHKEVKVYDYNPTYRLRINSVLCTYEIFVNDVLVDYSFSVGRTAGEQSVDIAQYILKSGKQNIRIKIYPNAIENGVLEQSVNKNTEFSTRVVYGEYYKEKNEDWNEVFNYKSSNIGDHLPYIEYKSEFEAKVPYTLKGWGDGVDLSKEDPEKLEKEVWAKFEEIKKCMKKRK